MSFYEFLSLPCVCCGVEVFVLCAVIPWKGKHAVFLRGVESYLILCRSCILSTRKVTWIMLILAFFWKVYRSYTLWLWTDWYTFGKVYRKVFRSVHFPKSVHPHYVLPYNCDTVVAVCAVCVLAKDNQPSTTHTNTLPALLTGNASPSQRRTVAK